MRFWFWFWAFFIANLITGGTAAFAQSETIVFDRTSAEGWQRTVEKVEPKDAAGWRAAAEGDVAFIEQAIRDHSPIFEAPAAIEIRKNFERGLMLARTRAAEVNDRGGYYATLSALGESIGDPHAGTMFDRNWNIGLGIPAMQWPGIDVHWLENAALVTRAAPFAEGWRVGDRIESCDGKSLQALMAANLLPFGAPGAYGGDDGKRTGIAGLFRDWSNPFIVRPQTCRVLRSDGPADIDLTWRAFDMRDAAPQAAVETTASQTLTLDNYAITTLDGGVVWVRLPSFSGDPSTSAAIAELAEQIAAGRKAVRAAPAVVLDVRGNSGGSSFNGDQIVEALWTRAELRRHGPRDKRIRIGWRASADNLEYWKDWTKAQAERGDAAGSEIAYGEKVIAGLQGAIARGDVLWTESSVGKNPPVARRTDRKPLFAAKVYMLSDGSCASACLDFADRALQMPGVSLIGAGTSGDGLLMEIRIERSPSGMASAKIAQKIYLNRSRGHLETYSADIEHTGAWDDAAVAAWVQNLLAEHR